MSEQIPKSFLQHVFIWLDKHYWWLHPALTACVTASGGFLTYHLPDEYESSHPIKGTALKYLLSDLPWIFGISLILLILTVIMNEYNRVTIRQLSGKLNIERERNNLISDNIEQLFNGILMQLATLLAFTRNDERVTLYIHDGNQTFVPCGRYSLDPEFRKKGRPQYSDNQGCIARGWRHGWHFDNDFGSNDLEHKMKCINTYGIPEKIYDEIGMKSRVYAVKALRDRGNNAPMAVVVVESTDSGRFAEAPIQTILNEQERYLSEMVAKLSQYVPTPEQATERGF